MNALSRGISTLVEHSAHHPKVDGLSPAYVTGTVNAKMARKEVY
jgi:hypothetical protein